MHILTRVSKTPASALTIQIDAPAGDGDGGFQAGGVYLFQPAKDDGSPADDGGQHQVSEHAARTIMGDSSLAQHFTCDPALAADEQPDGTSEPVKGKRKRGDTE